MHVPFLSYCGVPVKRAIATAAAVGLPLSASATLGYIIGGLDETGIPPASIGYVNLPVFGGVVGASLLFAPLGATLAHPLAQRAPRVRPACDGYSDGHDAAHDPAFHVSAPLAQAARRGRRASSASAHTSR